MKLFRISQSQVVNCDAVSSAIVIASDEESARNIDPGTGHLMTAESWDKCIYWCSGPEHVHVQYLGEAAEGVVRGVLCTSLDVE